MASKHEKWMKAALSLAGRSLGNTAPNPAVGCIIVCDNRVVGRGWTQAGGRPHAETEALRQAGSEARGAVAYVTLEPCAHHGKTAPCALALVDGGIKQVVIATKDPDPRVSGRGVEILEAAGVEVVCEVLQKEADEINAGFFYSVTESRPKFCIKSATSLDGKIATASGHSKWITGPTARHYGHMLRAQNDAILVGVETVLADDPMLDCRIAGLEDRSPLPIIMDSKLRTPIQARLVKRAKQQGLVLVCNDEQVESDEAKALVAAGVELLPVTNTRQLKEVALGLSSRGITRVLIEGGGRILSSFVRAGFCDEFHKIQAGKLLGAEGRPSLGELELAQVGDAPHLTLKAVRRLGPDLLATYVNAE